MNRKRIVVLQSYSQEYDEFYIKVGKDIFEINLSENIARERFFEGGLDESDEWKASIIVRR